MHRAVRLASQVTTSSTSSSSSASLVRVSASSTHPSVAVITLSRDPINSINAALLVDLERVYREVAAVGSPFSAAVLTSSSGARGTFVAGADLAFVRAAQAQAETADGAALAKHRMRQFLEQGNALLSEIEDADFPVVCAVNGAALGGGLEIAMACHARVAVDLGKKRAFGLPELSLGILPGLGGTQRLLRLVPSEEAIKATLTSGTFTSRQALQMGLFDEVVASPGELLERATALADSLVGQQLKRARHLLPSVRAVPKALRRLAAKKYREQFEPQGAAYLRCVSVGIEKGGDAGVQQEIDSLSELAFTPSAMSLIHVFLASKQTSKVPGVRVLSPKSIRTVAVIGGGTMGASIAALYLLSGYDVVLKEIADKYMKAAVKRVAGIVQKRFKRKPDKAKALLANKLHPVIEYEPAVFQRVDLVIEAVLEKLDLKQRIFADLEKACRGDCILATNTSTIDIDKIGAGTQRAHAEGRVLGLHFFSPAHVMPLLEIVRSEATSAEVLGKCLGMCKQIRKVGVVVGNCVGFTANRIFFPYGQSASLLVDRGVSPYRIDQALLRVAGMPMGVFQMADLSGVDIFAHTGKILDAAYGDRTYLGAMAKLMIEDNRLGQKTGKGYYLYGKGRGRGVPDVGGMRRALVAARKAAGNPPRVDAMLSDEQLVEAVLFPVVNESFRVVDEGHVVRASDVDLVSCFGYGFPRFRGGILHWAKHGVGLRHVVERLEFLAERLGRHQDDARVEAFYTPCAALKAAASIQA